MPPLAGDLHHDAVWMKKSVLKANRDEYYKKYMLVYFDDFLHLTHDSLAGMERLNQVYRLKEGLEKVQMEDGGGGLLSSWI